MDVVRGIGFDLDHTLAIDNRLERVALLRLLELLQLEGARANGPLSDEIDGIDHLLERQRRGEFTVDAAVARFVEQHGVEPAERYAEFFRASAVAMVGEFVVPLPGVGRTLAALRARRIPLAVLSNGWNPLQRCKAERAGFAGPIVVSSEIGVQKPAERAFERLLETLGTTAEQTLYVGDDPTSDVAGAQELGMQTVWINWERRQYPAGVCPPTHTIVEFDALLDLVPVPARAT
jgi:HAD superfamily hydrolase (TIGR01509 family)